MTDLEGTTLLDRYYLRQKVAKGGSADIYEALDRQRGTTMAIKILRFDHKLDGNFVSFFEKEAEWMRKLKHPYILDLFELVRKDDMIFMVLEWVEGSNLRDLIQQRTLPYPPHEVSQILYPICTALSYTHRQQVYHCDIKPSNILLAKDGRVFLMDFGVARLSNEKIGGGTPAYMSPEQILGERVDARTDIYSLGVTMFEMFSGGILPYRGKSGESQGNTPRERVYWEHCYLPIPPLHQYNPELPHEIVDIVLKSMNKDRRLRYSSAIELWEELEGTCKNLGKPSQDITQYSTEIISTTKQPATPIIQTPKIPTHLLPNNYLALPTGVPYLLGLSGDWNMVGVAINQERIGIGRGSHNQIQLNDQRVSRTHATIIRTRRGVYLQDENSLAGTFVNDQQIPAIQLLKDGDQVRIGSNWTFVFRNRR